MMKPDPLNMRLLPNMRAVNISVPKEQSAGGLIQEGEWVDVFLTTSITAGERETTSTAPLATALRVIAKRNALWRVLAPLPDNKPVNFTIEANPYRAALIEFGKSKGNLTLVPLSASEQKSLEERRTKLLAVGNDKLLPVSFGPLAPVEMAEEEARIDSFTRGDAPVGTADLVRIYGLSTPPPPSDPVMIERFNGLSRSATMRFTSDGQFVGLLDPKKDIRAASNTTLKSQMDLSAFQFCIPGCGTANSSCKSCKKK